MSVFIHFIHGLKRLFTIETPLQYKLSFTNAGYHRQQSTDDNQHNAVNCVSGTYLTLECSF